MGGSNDYGTTQTDDISVVDKHVARKYEVGSKLGKGAREILAIEFETARRGTTHPP